MTRSAWVQKMLYCRTQCVRNWASSTTSTILTFFVNIVLNHCSRYQTTFRKGNPPALSRHMFLQRLDARDISWPIHASANSTWKGSTIGTSLCAYLESWVWDFNSRRYPLFFSKQSNGFYHGVEVSQKGNNDGMSPTTTRRNVLPIEPRLRTNVVSKKKKR